MPRGSLIRRLKALVNLDWNHFADLPRNDALNLVGHVDPILLNPIPGNLFRLSNPRDLLSSFWFGYPIVFGPRLGDIAIFSFID